MDAKTRMDTFINTQAALHMPDKIAGGDYLLDIQGLGDSDVNSFIGTQWNSGGKIGQIKKACDSVDSIYRANTYVNVKLRLI